ncbi:hypothetical protein LIA77_05554 [Sarocladium implicatum]|nr:hypothetical protein LIA77_05554 [Sarocladium implicatum]
MLGGPPSPCSVLWSWKSVVAKDPEIREATGVAATTSSSLGGSHPHLFPQVWLEAVTGYAIACKKRPTRTTARSGSRAVDPLLSHCRSVRRSLSVTANAALPPFWSLSSSCEADIDYKVL